MSWNGFDTAWLAAHSKRIEAGTRQESPQTNAMPEPVSVVPEPVIVDPGQRQGPRTGGNAPGRVQRLHVPAIAPSINGLYTMHAMSRSIRAKEWKNLVIFCARDQRLQPVEHYPVTVHVVCWFGPGRRRYDWENLALSAKWTGDGLRAAGILENDSPDFIAFGTLESRRTERESYMEYFIHEPNEG